MWFWIALTAFFLLIYLVTRAMARGLGDSTHLGLQHHGAIGGAGLHTGAGDAWDGGDGGGGWSVAGGGGWGDGGGGGDGG